MSGGSRSYSLCRGALGQGSVNYYNFLKNIDLNNIDFVSKKLSDITQKYIVGSVPTAEYKGNDGYNNFKAKIISLFGNGKKPDGMNSNYNMSYNSAAIITKLTNANNFMLAGNIGETTYKYSGKMSVLANVISSKYLLPEMRGKYGAYGATMLIDKSGVTASVAGINDIDLAINIWNGMGNWLKNLDMTQNELDAIIVSTVKVYDEYYNYSEDGGIMALEGNTISDIKQIRNEMIDTKVSDLIGYTDFINEIVAQNHIYAVMGIEDAINSKFDFGYFANAETLEIIPRFTKNLKQYIYDETENMVAPDDYVTRAEIAEIINEVTADKSNLYTENLFKDVFNKDWFYNSVSSLASKGVISGYEDNRFCPNNYITRAEFVAMFSKYMFDEEIIFDNPYLDVSLEDWFFEAVLKTTKKGVLINDGDNTFNPHNNVTRAEAVTILNRMLNIEN